MKDDVVDFDSFGDWLLWKIEMLSKFIFMVMFYVDVKIMVCLVFLNGLFEDVDKYEVMVIKVKVGFNCYFVDLKKFNEDI